MTSVQDAQPSPLMLAQSDLGEMSLPPRAGRLLGAAAGWGTRLLTRS